VRFSIWPDMSHHPSEVLDLARWVDDGSWHTFWYADHYMPNTGSERIESGDVQECWAILPAVAAVTARVRVGSLVSPTSVHHPALLANRAASIDQLSDGRMVLGLGAGWQINEHRAYGIELEPPKRRVDRFEEAIEIVKSLLGQDRTTFEGEIHTILDAPCDPKPVQSPLPLLVGTGGRRMLRITARFADEWNTWGTVAIASERREAFVAACESVGRDPASMWTSVQAMIFLVDDSSAIERVLASDLGARAIAGSADHLVDQLGHYGELGFDEFNIPDWNLGATPEQRREGLERIRSEVLDRL
jgi:alkanesulfonate monooxygenase SsuD/methylene tetrahydromethanopterin reductase-like flavin-dependent oxidoreductase (luciferase family)